MITALLLFFIFFALAAFFAGSEMAFVSSDKLKLRKLAEAGNPAAGTLLKLSEEPQKILTTLLIANNIAHVTVTVLLTYILKEVFHLHSEWVVTAIMVPLLIIFAEMLPKDYGRLRAQNVLLQGPVLFLLRFFTLLFYYPTVFLLKVVSLILKRFGAEQRKNIFVNESEFRSLIEESVKSGVLNRYEKKIIDTIMDFERVGVSSVMIPLEKAPKVDLTANLGEVKRVAQEAHSRMVLVYEEEPSIVVGMIYVYDILFQHDDHLGLRNFLRSPVFLNQKASLEKAFLTLQEKRQSYAVVTDDELEVIGVVPIEKLLTL